MQLQAGSRLGSYEIISLLGAGGMGEVYKARDTRLDRLVAVKVIAHGAVSDDGRERLRREARATSSLQHRGICTLLDVGTAGEADFLVLEYLDGVTLAARLARGRLPWPELRDIAAQLAEALAAAHAQGLVHRDLKPANVMLTADGPKLLDFGLARRHAAAGAADVRALSTTADLTVAGMLVGTLSYMSPEQLEGKPADARSDLFAFGLVLYEMATGQRAFPGDSAMSIASKILGAEPPPIVSLRPDVDPDLAFWIASCLCKDPARRWRSAHDLALLLAAPPRARADRPGTPRGRRWLAAALGLAAVVGATAGLALLRRPAAAKPVVAEFEIFPPSGTSIALNGAGGYASVSPRGDRLALVLTDGHGVNRIWLRALGSAEARRLDGTEGASLPFWSPDGASLAFAAGTKLRRIEIATGEISDLTDLKARFCGGAWGEDGAIFLADGSAAPIERLALAGGTRSPLVGLDAARREVSQRAPFALPGGAVAFLSIDAAGERTVMAVPAAGGTARPLVASQSGPGFAEGYLLYTVDGRLRAQPFDPASLRLSGTAQAITPALQFFFQRSNAAFSAGANLLAYGLARDVKTRQMAWLDAQGRTTPALPPGGYGSPAVSEDGNYLLAGNADGTDGSVHVWRWDLARGTGEALTSKSWSDVDPLWCDATHTAFSRYAAGGMAQILELDLATRQERVLVDGPASLAFGCPGGKVLFAERVDGRRRLALLDRASNQRQSIGGDAERLLAAALSPDGRWLASTEPGSEAVDLYVTDLRQATPRLKVASAADEPRWMPDGRALLFLGDDNTLFRLPIDDARGVGVPTALFQILPSRYGTSYSIAGDGRVLVNSLIRERTAAGIVVDLHWRSRAELATGAD